MRRTRGVAAFRFLGLSVLAPLVTCDVLRLTDSNYSRKTAGKSFLIKACEHSVSPVLIGLKIISVYACMASTPISTRRQLFLIKCERWPNWAAWDVLAAGWEGHSTGLVAQVNCSNSDSLEICARFFLFGLHNNAWWGHDPEDPYKYSGELDYDNLLDFARDKFHKPICSVFSLKDCSSEEREVIDKFGNRSTEELEAMEQDAKKRLGRVGVELSKQQDEVDELHTEMESLKRALEVLQKKIDQIVEETHATVYEKARQEIRHETDFKWIQQVLAKIDAEGKAKEEL
jgi:hypothetical protein